MSLIVQATLALLLVAMLGLGFVAWLNSAAANRQAQLAEYEKNLNSNPAASLHAALQAWREKPWWQKHNPQAEEGVRSAFDANRQWAVLPGHHGNVVTSQFAPDGRTVLTQIFHGSVRDTERR